MARDSNATLSRMKVTPVPVQKSRRSLEHRVLTSMPPGRMVPLAAFPLLREDRLNYSKFRASFEMDETVEVLMNAINVRILAYFVPNLAFPHFDGIDTLNRSYMKVPATDGGTVTPFFHTMAFDRATNEIMTYMGKHAREGQMVNSAYVEAYNLIWNYRAANRSPDIALRVLTDVSLAKSFWAHQRFAAIVPDFDQATIDGEVPLNVTEGALPIRGLGVSQATVGTGPHGVKAAGGWQGTFDAAYVSSDVGQAFAMEATDKTAQGFPAIYAEMIENGITVSLSNIELARKTQAWAGVRRQYTGHSDEYIIDLLMGGITVPEQEHRVPWLIADRSTIFGMSKRYSSSADDLTASVANGATFIDFNMGTPTTPTGGVVMVVAEIAPEQLWERQMDPYMFISDTELLPEFLRDTLDPEKVEVVPNEYVDIDHDTPTATFGYAPLNYKWNSNPPGIGGRFYRPEVDAAFDEDRQRIWAVETANPTLSEDFYLCTNMHQKPFKDLVTEPFSVVMRGVANITGNTVFGRVLLEATDDYDTIMDEAPIDKIDKPVTPATEENL